MKYPWVSTLGMMIMMPYFSPFMAWGQQETEQPLYSPALKQAVHFPPVMPTQFVTPALTAPAFDTTLPSPIWSPLAQAWLYGDDGQTGAWSARAGLPALPVPLDETLSMVPLPTLSLQGEGEDADLPQVRSNILFYEPVYFQGEMLLTPKALGMQIRYKY